MAVAGGILTVLCKGLRVLGRCQRALAEEREAHTLLMAEHERELLARERRRIGALLAPGRPSSDFEGCVE